MPTPIESRDPAAPTLSRRLLANRRNARKSTGPKTVEGKAASSRNALKHGLSGAGEVVPEALEAAAARKVEGWVSSLKPRNETERGLVEVGAMTMTRFHQCWREEHAARGRSIVRAENAWEADRKAEASQLALRLPKAPESVADRLRQTLHGAKWMLGRWELLAARLEKSRVWTGAQRTLALDLLGTPPEFRDDQTPIDFPDLSPDESHAALVRFIAARIAELQDEIDRRLTPLDDADRAMRLADLALVADPDLARLNRYERALSNRVLRVLDTLRGLGGAVGQTKPTEASEAPPVSAANVEMKTGSALTVCLTLVPEPPAPVAVEPVRMADWLEAKSDDEIEQELLPLVIARVGLIHERLRLEYGSNEGQA